MLSNTSRYAIRALIYLAIHTSDKKKIGIKKIADELEIPSPFLGKILQTLVRQNLLASIKGPNGGFGVNDTTGEVTLMRIIKIIDGDDLFNRCLISNKICDKNRESTCALHDHYESIRGDIVKLFSTHTIGSLAKEFSTSGKKIEI
ncbi:MAG: Rrf2 family transcriptional regulator [Bacteroidales bacterium]|nr:Rrf2 family transcriptional regulator [Bacteroidales bacterium]